MLRSLLPVLAIWLLAAVTTGLLVAIASGSARAQEESRQKSTVSKSDGVSSKKMFLSKWKRAVGLRSSADPKAYIYLRFYEWNLLGSVEAWANTALLSSAPAAAATLGAWSMMLICWMSKTSAAKVATNKSSPREAAT